MYISEVSGHHSATIAIEKAIKILSPDSEVLNINTFNYTNPISEKIINRLYLGVIKNTPKIWDLLYDNPKVAESLASIKETIHKMNSPKLKVLFDKFKPDVVACTQAFPCGMVADYKNMYNSKIPLLAVLTDYIPHSYWIYDNINYYVVPSEEVGLRLINKGVQPGKVKVLGIPFDPKFNREVSKERIREKLGLDKNKPTLLIMGGGQGLGPVKIIIKALEKTLTPLEELIVTGTNKKLYNSLRKKQKKFKKSIKLFGYVNNINELMEVSDIIVSKPGGITTAEALSKKLPMIIIKPIPGQEANNTAFLTEKKAAIKLDDAKQINSVVDDLFLNRGKLKKLSDSAGKISKPNASLDIASLILNTDHA